MSQYFSKTYRSYTYFIIESDLLTMQKNVTY